MSAVNKPKLVEEETCAMIKYTGLKLCCNGNRARENEMKKERNFIHTGKYNKEKKIAITKHHELLSK